MTSIWPEVNLGEVFEVSSSKRVMQSDWKSSGVPFYRAREIVKLAKEGAVANELFISEELYRSYSEKHGAPQPGDLMISAVGTLGACYVVQPMDRFYYKDASVLRLTARQEICPRFFLHAFRTSDVLDQVNAGSGSTVGTYTIERANATRLLVPPVHDQRRIAAILDEADAIRAKRREALATLDSLTQSIFIEMFGDPESGRSSVPVTTLGKVCLRITDGTHQSPKWESSGVPFIFISNIVQSQINFDTNKYISEETYYELTRRCPIEVGDVLYTTVGSYGNVAVVSTSQKFAFQRHIAHIKPDHTKLAPTFCAAMLRSPVIRRQVDRVARGVAQKTVNLSDLSALRVFEPPMQVQQQFALRVDAIESVRASHVASLHELDSLFGSLQHRAFAGQLS